jgi:hypothetical protein
MQRDISSYYSGNHANIVPPQSNKRDLKSASFSQNKKQKTVVQNVNCPVCNLEMKEDPVLMNLHLDFCVVNATGHNKRSRDECKQKLPIQTVESVFCPVCNLEMKDASLMNLHLDICIQKKESQRNAPAHISPEKNRIFVVQEEGREFRVEEHAKINGLWFIFDFITEEEETNLVNALDHDKPVWRNKNFNGCCDAKTYGVRTQFGLPGEQRLVRENNPDLEEYSLPQYLYPYIERLQQISLGRSDLFPHDLKTFQPNECSVISYEKAKNHFLKFHFDDRTLSGPLLMNLSLQGEAKMTYLHPATKEAITVDLPRRCLQVIGDDARWDFMHGMKVEDFLDPRRVSITLRQCGGKKGILPLAVKTPVVEQIIAKKEVKHEEDV